MELENKREKKLDDGKRDTLGEKLNNDLYLPGNLQEP